MLRSGGTLMDVAQAAELSEEAMRFARPDRKPQDYVAILVRNRLFDDAVAFLALVLPLREAVWWAWSCARDAAGETAAPPIEAALEAARVWILEPTEENRRTAGDAAEALEYEGPAAFVALSVFLSGGSVGPADAPPAPPGPHEAARAIAGTVVMAAGEGDPSLLKERYSMFIGRAMERADKGDAWGPPAEPATTQG
jgi:Family of unknown function (DUF6931)